MTEPKQLRISSFEKKTILHDSHSILLSQSIAGEMSQKCNLPFAHLSIQLHFVRTGKSNQPIRSFGPGADAAKVRRLSVRPLGEQRKLKYLAVWITYWEVNSEYVAAMVTSARARWKIENENNNVLKTKG